MSNDIETFWSTLHGEIENIYQRNRMDNKTRSKLFTDIYDYCLNSKLEPLNTESTFDRKRYIGGGDLYAKFKEYLENYVENLRQQANNLQDQELLKYYIKTWNDYQFSSKVTNSLCKYLNDRWIQYERNANRTDIYEIFILSLKIWENVLFKPLQEKLIGACLHLIEAERKNETIERQLIKDVIQICVALDNNDAQAKSEFLIESAMPIYQEYFEKPFLKETEQFYRIEANNYLNIVKISVSDYLKTVAQRLNEEPERVRAYLHSSTEKALIDKLNEVLIKEHLKEIYEAAKILLQNNQNTDLALLFTLVSRIPDATNQLIQIVEDHIHQTGRTSIASISATAINDPKIYVEAIITLHTHFLTLIKDAFNAEKGFITALDKACAKFINYNAVTEASPIGTRKSSEFLARYCDKILRSNQLNETEANKRFDQIMTVFKYIEDKDVFRSHYTRLMGKRLIDQLSASDEYEQSMVTRLQEVCGSEYVEKWKNMLTDVQVSKTTLQEYRVHCNERNDIQNLVDFSVMVLNGRTWSFCALQSFIIPGELKPRFDHFTDFYKQKQAGHKLFWSHGHSKGELETTFTTRPYTLCVSLFQMHVLLLFNEELEWTVEHIHTKTLIREDLLVQVLDILIKKNLLTCPQIANTNQSALERTHTIRLGTNFTNDRVRVNLNVPLRNVEQRDTDRVHERNDDKRFYILQSRIMRKMKTHKVLQQSLLIQEVIEIFCEGFVPKIPMIKKCIEHLINEKYLERMPDDHETLRYIASD